MIKLETARTKPRIDRFTRSIIHNNLFVHPTWGIYTSIQSFKGHHTTIETVILAKDTQTNNYIGCCMYVPQHRFSLQTFVAKTHRRHGIGTVMLKKIRRCHPDVIFSFEAMSHKNKDFYNRLPKVSL